MTIWSLFGSPWAILPAKLEEIVEVYQKHIRGEAGDLTALAAKLGRPVENKHERYSIQSGVAVVPVHGVIAKRMNYFSDISGGVSTELLARDFQDAQVDPDVHAILLDVDSPGGEVDGTSRLARLIFESRGQKPVVAVGDGMMASAAYWIASAADRVYAVSPTTQVGSIGVVAMHTDLTGADALRGVKRTLITAGQYKAVGSPYRPLDDTGRAEIQDQVDTIYQIFVDAVADHRGRLISEVLEKMADGKIFIGDHAVRAGLVDGFKTREEVIQELAGRGSAGAAPSGNAGGQIQTVSSKAGVRDAVDVQAECERAWLENRSGVRQEFTSKASFIAYERAKAQGRVRDCDHVAVRAARAAAAR